MQQLEEGRKTHRLKFCEYNNKDENNGSNILNDKNYFGLSFEIYVRSIL